MFLFAFFEFLLVFPSFFFCFLSFYWFALSGTPPKHRVFLVFLVFQRFFYIIFLVFISFLQFFVFLRFVLKYVRQMIRSQTLKIISKKQNCNSSGRANHPQTIYRFRDDSNARTSYNFNTFFQPDKNTLNQATLRLVSLRLSLIF